MKFFRVSFLLFLKENQIISSFFGYHLLQSKSFCLFFIFFGGLEGTNSILGVPNLRCFFPNAK